MSLTAEQRDVVEYTGRKLVVRAFAGTGKTFTLVQYAKKNPTLNILYLAYNRAIRDEAVQKFPRNVDCQTSHQLAYSVYGHQFKHKIVQNVRLMEIARALDTGDWVRARDVYATLLNFMASADPVILNVHIPGFDPDPSISSRRAYQQAVKKEALRLWNRMVNIDDAFPMMHDAYLKLFQLSGPDLSDRYDVILFDEAQDANPVTSAFVLNQRCRMVFVGDPHQQIYRWRGAENALGCAALDKADRLYLTHSFRFGPKVSEIANALLAIKNEAKKVTGYKGNDRVVKQLPADTRHYAKLHRTVAGAIYSALTFAGQGKKIFWVGGIEGYSLSDIEDMYRFFIGRADLIRNKRLVEGFSDYEQFVQIAQATKDSEMNRVVRILEEYGTHLPDLLPLLYRQSVKAEHDADVTISTAHRAKGLEWDRVELESDFCDIFNRDMANDKRDDEINLLYVAATRAMEVLCINDVLNVLANKHSIKLC